MSTTPSTMSPQLSRILGALLGVHAGDSLGATLEFETFQQIKKHYPDGLRDIIGGGVFGWPAGHATDDTDLTRAVLLAYHDRKGVTHGFDITRSAADYSLKWYNGDWPNRRKGQQPRDVGNATRIGLMKYSDSQDPRKSGAGRGSAGNGSLMRCIPTALFALSKEDRIKESMEISAITHNDERCTISCAAYNEIVAALIDGKSPEQAVAVGIQTAEDLDRDDVKHAIESGMQMSIETIASKGPGDFLPSGYVLQSLTVAIAALLDPRSLEDVLVDVVRIGGDTDTNGAISGGLLGARDGVGAIPERWLNTLQFRVEFEELAKGFL